MVKQPKKDKHGVLRCPRCDDELQSDDGKGLICECGYYICQEDLIIK